LSYEWQQRERAEREPEAIVEKGAKLFRRHSARGKGATPYNGRRQQSQVSLQPLAVKSR
jgi:hypothetical protein